jgi:hypothetical protein
MSATPNSTASAAADDRASARRMDKGMEEALGVGKNGKVLNAEAQDLQDDVDDMRDEFLAVRSIYVGGKRHDVKRNGMVAEIVSRVPIIVYDLPELKRICNTAFVDMTGKIYVSDTFGGRVVAESKSGKDAFPFLTRHEGEHLRRDHMQRMLDLPGMLANIAQDIRINIDNIKGEAAERYYTTHGTDPNPADLLKAVQAYQLEMSTTALRIGYAMTYEEYVKYDGLSEEAIGAILLAEWVDPPSVPNREVVFEHIMLGAAGESDLVKSLLVNGFPLAKTAPRYALTPVELSGLSQDLRLIGKNKASHKTTTDKQLQDCLDLLGKLREHQGLLELDMRHGQASMSIAGTGGVHKSGTSGDDYLDAMQPSERVQLAFDVLDSILNPKPENNLGGKAKGGGLTIKDLDRMRKNPGSTMGANTDGQQSSSVDDKNGGPGDDNVPDMVPMPNVYNTANHTMGPEELQKILKDAGLSNESLEKLGYNDLDTINGEINAAKQGVTSAINQASEDMMAVGSRYPGGHLVNYAKAQMVDFFKPVLTWTMAMKKIIDGAGRGSRHSNTKPWSIFHADHRDLGLRSAGDIPYRGSRLPGKKLKPLIFVVIDTSGSVDDAMLKRFISEGVAMASAAKSRGEAAPEVVLVFADSIARGEPVYITEKNVKEILKKGVNYGGRGGTNFQAGIESVFEMVKPGSKSGFAGRTIDAIIYKTDTGDRCPDPQRLLTHAISCGVKQLPTTLFIAPKACMNDSFNAEVKKWADIVYFDSSPGHKPQNIDLNKAGADQANKNRHLTPTP